MPYGAGQYRGKVLIVETKITQWMKTQAFNDRQKRLVVGSLLGDAHVVRTTQGYAYRANHGKAQRDYIHWKYQLLKPFIRTEPKLSQDRCWHFRTVTHPEMSGFRSRWYEGNRKRLCIKDVEEYLDAFPLAVWIMDDGFNRKDCLGKYPNTQAYEVEGQGLLQNCLQRNFGIQTRIHWAAGRPRLYIDATQAGKFVKIIRHEMIPSMMYKISNPVTTGIPDVRTGKEDNPAGRDYNTPISAAGG